MCIKGLVGFWVGDNAAVQHNPSQVQHRIVQCSIVSIVLGEWS